MKTIITKKTVALIALLTMMISTANAQRKAVRHSHQHPTTVVVKPVVTAKTRSLLCSSDRMVMALRYLDEYKKLTARKYASLTGLTVKAAKLELESFAKDNHVPIKHAKGSKGSVYVKG